MMYYLVFSKFYADFQKLTTRAVQRENIFLYLDKVAIEDSFVDVDLNQLIDIDSLLLASSKSSFLVVEDDATIMPFSMHIPLLEINS